jgi:hypothetical protein
MAKRVVLLRCRAACGARACGVRRWGECLAVPASTNWDFDGAPIGTNEGERIAAAPVPLRNKLLVRGVDHLFCLGAK